MFWKKKDPLLKSAAKFAKKHKKDQVIIVSFSRKKQTTYITSCGKTFQDRHEIAQFKNFLINEITNRKNAAMQAQQENTEKAKG